MVKNQTKRNIVVFVLLMVMSIGLFACKDNVTEESQPSLKTYYTISFYMDDGYTKLNDLAFEEGSVISYTDTPVKSSTEDAKFNFVGWSLEVGGEVAENIIADKNKNLYAVFVAIPIDKTSVKIPLANQTKFIYDGTLKNYYLEESDYYNISGSYQTNAGKYQVIVSLKDHENMVWEDGTSANKYYDFVISSAENSWIENPNISGWRVEDALNGINKPVGKAMFGEVSFSYSDSEDGVYLSEVPNKVGKYYLKAEVAGNENYSSLSIIVSFMITTDILPIYEINFYDVDNQLLNSQTIKEGSEVSYLGEALGEVGINFTTELIGWNDGQELYTNTLPKATGDVNYYAVYKTSLIASKGEIGNPYRFSSIEEMIYLSNFVNNGENCEEKYFVLENDLDLTQSRFESIGSVINPFKGIFDFNNKRVVIELNGHYSGLFGNNGGTISNLSLVAKIDNSTVAGGVAAINTGTISNCYVNGRINATQNAGGLVGINNGLVEYSKSIAAVAQDNSYQMTDLVGKDGFGIYVGATEANHSLILTDTIWNGSSASNSFAKGSGTKEDPYQISSAEDLAYLKVSTNAANSYYKDKYFILTKDIDLGNHLWSGIGTGMGVSGFAGYFDGNGYAIYNVKLDSKTTGRRGFFNSIAQTAEVRNLTIFGSAETNATYVGLLAGISLGLIDNCQVFGNLVSTNKLAGLLIAWQDKSDIINCRSYGNITATDAVGGIVGYNCRSNGADIGEITNCSNYATIIATGLSLETNETGVGGIVGLTGSATTISGCNNYGSISTDCDINSGIGGIVGNLYPTVVINCNNYGAVSGVVAVGGIVGYGRQNGSIENCENKGVITGSYHVGGISGENRSNITNSKNHALVTVSDAGAGYWIGGIAGMSGAAASITSCENNGTIIGIGSSFGGVGGIIGGLYGKLSNCINNGNIYGELNLGGIVGYVQANTGEIKDSRNNGDVHTSLTSGTVNLGCIAGNNLGIITGNENYGKYVLPAENECVKYDFIVGYDTVGETGVYNNINYVS